MNLHWDEIGYRGKYIRVRSLEVNGTTIVVLGRIIRTARLKEEEYQSIDNPQTIISKLRLITPRLDLFTFKQRLPNTQPMFPYYHEFDSIAALPISTYQEWFSTQIDSNSKRAIEKAKKRGIEVMLTEFNPAFVRGMQDIFNESPIRQGKRFWHYGKTESTITNEFSRNLSREDIIAAYFKGELVGFVFLAFTGQYAIPTQILSKLAHRDKSVTNALLAKAVEVCETKQIPYIVYGDWKENGLTEFKRRNGFVKIGLPRYYVPLTLRGSLIIRLGLQRGLKGRMPKSLKFRLTKFRSKWNDYRFGDKR